MHLHLSTELLCSSGLQNIRWFIPRSSCLHPQIELQGQFCTVCVPLCLRRAHVKMWSVMRFMLQHISLLRIPIPILLHTFTVDCALQPLSASQNKHAGSSISLANAGRLSHSRSHIAQKGSQNLCNLLHEVSSVLVCPHIIYPRLSDTGAQFFAFSAHVRPPFSH